MTNLAEATADPVLELDARGNPMGAIAMDPDIRVVVYDGLDQEDGTVDSPPPLVASEAEQNDESQPIDQ